jgi:hypothetical protein
VEEEALMVLLVMAVLETVVWQEYLQRKGRLQT